MHIIHLIDSVGIGGAQSMILNINLSISHYYPEIKQSTYRLQHGANQPISPTHFNLIKDQSITISQLIELLKTLTGPRILYHKTLGSKTIFFPELLHNCPVFCVNHTRSDSKDTQLIGRCSGIIAVSNEMREYLQPLNPHTPVTTIQNAVFEPLFAKFSANKRDPNIFLTGRINRLCDHKYKMEWTNLVHSINIGKPHHHHYIGDGPHLAQAIEHNKSLPPSQNKVVFLGPVTANKAKIEAVKSWDLTIYESLPEGISVSLLESLASGTPILCNAVPGNSEIIYDGINGHLYRSYPDLIHLLKHYVDHPHALKQLKSTTKQIHSNSQLLADEYVNLLK